MTVFVCLSNGNGMMFHNRRQSRDIRVVEDMIQSTHGERLLMDDYSKPLFEDVACKIELSFCDNFLDEAAEESYCFVENQLLAPYEDKISRLIVYRWNRDYPDGMVLDIDLQQWELKETSDFEGKSHKKITREVYVK